MANRLRRLIVPIVTCLLAAWSGARLLAAEQPAAKPKAQRDANRLTYLDENNPWHPHRDFPKLITPQWVGEEGVECVVTLGIDDMRDSAKYETYLRPILNRLKKIDGRAPVSIMTCSAEPNDPQIQQWLAEGLSIEVHTADHPCPLLAGGDLAKAKSTYDRCVDQLHEIPGSKPVAFRTPCCDSLNTVSPRFFSEIFGKETPKGHSLSIDSSVFNLLTANDPSIPRELLLDPDGREKFRKYLPKGVTWQGRTFETFVNYIEDYPYPYVINRTCWEFPCVVPSDWSAQHLQKPNHPDTVRDLKAALDIVVLKQGVYNLVFHPHGWIKAEQIVELIDHAVEKHGKKVKFLTFREANDRLNLRFKRSEPEQLDTESTRQIVLLDINGDGFMDVFHPDDDRTGGETQVWDARKMQWTKGQPLRIKKTASPQKVLQTEPQADPPAEKRRGNVYRFGPLSIANLSSALPFWASSLISLSKTLKEAEPIAIFVGPARLRDLDRDGICEVLAITRSKKLLLHFDRKSRSFKNDPLELPAGVKLLDGSGRDAGLRFVDIDEDGYDDIVFSDAIRYGIYLFESKQAGWSRVVLEGTRPLPLDIGGPEQKEPPPQIVLPPIVREDGSDNGFFVHGRHLIWQNEDTDKLPDLIERRSFNELLAQADLPPRPKSPNAARNSLRARPGFKVELMAAEPLTFDPVAFAFGADGKLWVAEMGDYPFVDDAAGQAEEKTGRVSPRGRVRFLEDTNSDGTLDRSTLFLDVPFPTGVLPWKRGVLITAAPDIIYAEDTDGDGRADKREVLYSGFVEGNQQHRLNGLVRGLDNWLYVANGDSGGQVRYVGPTDSTAQKQSAAKGAIDIGGRDLRIRPDTGALEAVAGQTQFGRNRDDWGNWFGCNNSNPMYQFVLDDHYQSRNPHFAASTMRVDVPEVGGNSPVFPISLLLARFNDFHTANRFTSACSAMVYRDDLFGPQFAGNMFVSEPVHNLVHREIMTPQGATFRSRRAPDEQQSEFLASSDNWFRPTMIQTGPDGALWVADMYRHVIEHPQWIPDTWQKKLDLRAGYDKGRIYRVYRVDKSPRPIPRLDRLDTAGLVAALDNHSGWQRDTAQQLLIERHDLASAPLLEKQVQTSQNPLCRLHALCTLDGLGVLRTKIFDTALNDPHPGVRRHAVRLAESLAKTFHDLRAPLAKMTDDPDAAVRLQLAWTLGEIGNPATGAALGKLLVQAKGDPFLFAAAMSSLNGSNIEAVLAAVLEADSAAAQANLLEILLNQATAWGNRRAFQTLLSTVATPRNDRFETWQFSAVGAFLDSLDRRRKSLHDLRTDADPQLLESLDNLQRLFAAARERSKQADASLEERLAVVQLLGRGFDKQNEDRESLAAFLTPQIAPELQSAAVVALGRLREGEVAEVLLRAWRSYGPARRAQVLDVLLSRDPWIEALLSAIEKEEVGPADPDAARRQRLVAHRSSEIRERATRLLTAAGNSSRQEIVETYRESLSLRGDALHGAQVFAKTCAQCHRLAGVGYEVGPDLASLTDKSPEAILVAVLDPNRAVEDKFLSYTAITTTGLSHSGLLAAETGNSITLRSAEGKQQTILRSDLEELVSTSKSAMPEGLERDLSPQDLADVTAHIRSNVPLPARKEFTGNLPELIRVNSAGEIVLSTATCEIYGSTLILEPQYGNLGYWSSTDDHVVWQLETPQAGRYHVKLDLACHAANAGNVWRLEGPGGALNGEVRSTGDWDTYQVEDVGEIALTKGQQRLTLRPLKRPSGALMDLKSVTLTPVK